MNRSLLYLLVLGGGAPAFAAPCGLPEPPVGARVEMVAPDMQFNGVPMTIRAIHAKGTPDQLLAHYRTIWARLATASRPASLEQNVNGWRVISTVQGECFTTVQVKAESSGSYALVSVSRKPAQNAKLDAPGKGFPLLPGSKVLNDFTYRDDIRNARTLVLNNQATLTTNLTFYRDQMQDAGWQLLSERRPTGPDNQTYVLTLKKELQEASIVLSQAQGLVTVVVNVVDRP